jgi:hypothetical protein
MLPIHRAVPMTLAAMAMIAAAPRSPNLLRHAISPVVALEAGKGATLSGESDGERVEARLALSAVAGLETLSISQDGQPLGVAASALQGVSGANRVWLEERGALTTLVVEGASDGKDWRLALEFHDNQLWLRRLSREGLAKDSFIFFEPANMRPRREQHRHFEDRGFHR